MRLYWFCCAGRVVTYSWPESSLGQLGMQITIQSIVPGIGQLSMCLCKNSVYSKLESVARYVAIYRGLSIHNYS